MVWCGHFGSFVLGRGFLLSTVSDRQIGQNSDDVYCFFSAPATRRNESRSNAYVHRVETKSPWIHLETLARCSGQMEEHDAYVFAWLQ